MCTWSPGRETLGPPRLVSLRQLVTECGARVSTGGPTSRGRGSRATAQKDNGARCWLASGCHSNSRMFNTTYLSANCTNPEEISPNEQRSVVLSLWPFLLCTFLHVYPCPRSCKTCTRALRPHGMRKVTTISLLCRMDFSACRGNNTTEHTNASNFLLNRLCQSQHAIFQPGNEVACGM